MDFQAIKAAALGALDSLVQEIDPGAQRSGREWILLNPRRSDNKRKSFSINRDTGVWSDFAASESGGDAVSWWAYCRNMSQGEAGKELEARFNLGRPKASEKPWSGPKPALVWVPMHEAPEVPYVAPRGASVVWPYCDEEGRQLFQRPRFERPTDTDPKGKAVTWWGIFRHSDGRMEWKNQAPPSPRPLFGLQYLKDPSKTAVLVVEGEKAAVAAKDLFPRFAVVTSGAADSAGTSNWEPLRGHQDVIHWPDHDEAGLKYAGAVHAQLKALGIKLRVVAVPSSFPDKWDLADPSPVPPFELQRLMDEARPWEGEEEKPSLPPIRIIDTSEWGIRVPPPLLWALEGLVPQGQPGIWAGRSNCGKSLGAIQLGHSLALERGLWGLNGPAGPMFSLYVSMEDGEEELERRWARSLAITAEDFPEWSRDHVHQIQRNFRPLVPDWKSPSSKTLPHLVDHIKRAFDTQCPDSTLPGLILLDTLAALSEGEENNAEAHQAFWSACHNITAATGATVMALHHSKKPMGPKPPSMSERMSFDFIRGSSAIVAGARFVLQMEPTLRSEAELLGLDPERAAAGNFPILGLSKQVSGPKGEWYLLEQRQAHSPGAGFFTPHAEADELVAKLKGKGATKKLNQLEAVLLDLHKGVRDRVELVRRNWPDLDPEEGEKKLKDALGDMRRRKYKWVQAGNLDLTETGFNKARVLAMAQSIRSGMDELGPSNPDEDGFNNDAA